MRDSNSSNGNWTKISLFLLGFWALSATGLVLPSAGSARAEGQARSRYEILKQRAEAEEAREKEWRKRYAKHVQDFQNARKRLARRPGPRRLRAHHHCTTCSTSSRSSSRWDMPSCR